jgi:hypothetical protein
MKIEVSNGEIIDKLTIIEIKLENITNPEKLEHLKNEWGVLEKVSEEIIAKSHPLYQELLGLNRKLWDIEDQIRDLEQQKDFGADFIELARLVYFTNDKRAEAKRKINELTGSNLVEVKSYKEYA